MSSQVNEGRMVFSNRRSMRRKQPGDPVTLKRNWWYGEEPKGGDELKTATGRRYLILSVRGKRLDCVVCDPTDPVEGTVFDWQWGKRPKSMARR